MNVKKLKSAIGIVVTWALSFMLMAVLALFSGDGVSSMGHPAGNPLAIRHTISLL